MRNRLIPADSVTPLGERPGARRGRELHDDATTRREKRENSEGRKGREERGLHDDATTQRKGRGF